MCGRQANVVWMLLLPDMHRDAMTSSEVDVQLLMLFFQPSSVLAVSKQRQGTLMCISKFWHAGRSSYQLHSAMQHGCISSQASLPAARKHAVLFVSPEHHASGMHCFTVFRV